MSARKALLVFVLLVPLFNLLTVLALPTAVNWLVMRRIATQGMAQASAPASSPEAAGRQATVMARQGRNIALPAPPADANTRTVVRLSPDLLYTACVFDLSGGQLHLSAPVPPGYLSISGFAANTDNFFAVNDSDARVDADGRHRLDLLLTADARTPAPPGMRVVVAPSQRGLVLFRTLIPDEALLPQWQADYQQKQRCEPLR
jgi:uncharacterized membrane protein